MLNYMQKRRAGTIFRLVCMLKYFKEKWFVSLSSTDITRTLGWSAGRDGVLMASLVCRPVKDVTVGHLAIWRPVLAARSPFQIVVFFYFGAKDCPATHSSSPPRRLPAAVLIQFLTHAQGL